VFPAIVLYLSLAFCALGIGLAVTRYDLYVREPWYMLLGAVAMGAVAMLSAYGFEVAIIRAAGRMGRPIDLPTLAAVAGVTEELAKFMTVIVIAIFAKRHFGEPMDGLVYGSFVGLGAAIEESVWLLRQLPETAYLPPQEPVRLVGHLVMGGIGGFGLGLAAARSRWAAPAVVLTLGAAIILHTAWDIVAFQNTGQKPAGITTWRGGLPVVLMLVGMITYRRLVHIGGRLMRAHLNVCDLRTRRCPPF
jgi:RsiW-degrading membrane proteinase PrsW (M82 family)